MVLWRCLTCPPLPLHRNESGRLTLSVSAVGTCQRHPVLLCSAYSIAVEMCCGPLSWIDSLLSRTPSLLHCHTLLVHAVPCSPQQGSSCLSSKGCNRRQKLHRARWRLSHCLDRHRLSSTDTNTHGLTAKWTNLFRLSLLPPHSLMQKRQMRFQAPPQMPHWELRQRPLQLFSSPQHPLPLPKALQAVLCLCCTRCTFICGLVSKPTSNWYQGLCSC